MNQPKEYSKHSYFQKTDNNFVINKYFHLMKWKNCHQKILDIGSGEGYTTLEILLPKIENNLPQCSRNDLKITGSDLSTNMVEFANQMCQNPNVNFIQLNIESVRLLGDLEENFDHIFSFYCLHWVQNQKRAFQNIFKMLKPGGDVLLSFLTHHQLYDVYEIMGKNIHWTKYHKSEYISPYHDCHRPEEEVQRVLSESGFEDVKCTIEDRSFLFPNWDQLIKSVIAVNPVIPQLSPKEKDLYIADFIRTTKKLLGFDLDENNNSEGIPARYKLIVVYAVKPVE